MTPLRLETAPRADGRVIYTVPCHRPFRSAVLALADRRGVEIAELVRGVLALVDRSIRDAMPDPGEPSGEDRDAMVPRRQAGDERRTVPHLVPSLVLRLEPGLSHAIIRRALALALALAERDGWRLVPAAELARLTSTIEKLEYRNRALAAAVERLSYRKLDRPVDDVQEAIEVLGLLGEGRFDEQRVVRRFRELAPIYHPDTGLLPCRQRLAQLIEARNVLVRHLRPSR
jgi:hypothetical protein